MSSRAGFRLLFLWSLLWSSPASAVAVCLEPNPKVCAEFFRSDAVFTGTVVSERVVPDTGDLIGGWAYQLRVEHGYRGVVDRMVEVFTENSSGRLPLDVGREYLLFAHADGGQLVITCCGNSGFIAQRQQQLRWLDEPLRGPSASIEGRVVSRPAWKGLAGVPIRVVGAKARYNGTSGPKGEFKIVVAPGAYRITAPSPGVVPFDLSYDDPGRVELAPGQCSQVQFVREQLLNDEMKRPKAQAAEHRR